MAEGRRLQAGHRRLVVRKDAVENDPEAFAAFMDGYAASVEAANSDLEGTAALCEQYGVVAKAALARRPAAVATLF